MINKPKNYFYSKSRYYRSESKRKRKTITWIISILALMLVLVFFTGSKSMIKLFSLRQERNQLLQQKEELLRQNDSLQKEIEKLKHDNQYLEKIAREKYNMKKEKEEVYIIEGK